MEKKILYLDASAFGESGCLRKLQFIMSDGLRSKDTSSALTYGTAVHKYVAHLRTTGKHDEASMLAMNFYLPHSLKIKEKDFRTIVHLSKTLNGYYKNVYIGDAFNSIKKDGVAQIEQKFAFPAVDIFPELSELMNMAGIIIILCGTVDDIGVVDGNNITIKDIKTSSEFRIYEYLEGYSISTQMMFYRMVVEHILGIKNVGVMIDGIFLNSLKPTEFMRSRIFDYSDYQMERFKNGLRITIELIIKNFTQEKWQENYALCSSQKYQANTVGKCPFFKLCSAFDDEIMMHHIKGEFRQVAYEPLRFDEFKG